MRAAIIVLSCLGALPGTFLSDVQAAPPTASAEETTGDDAPQLPPVVLRLVRSAAVWKELGLSPPQQQRVEALLTEVDGPWWRSRLLTPAARAGVLNQLTDQVMEQLNTILTASQQSRFQQIARQALGTRMVFLPEVAGTLAFSPEDRERFSQLAVATDRAAAAWQAARRSGEKGEPLERAWKEAQQAEQEGVVAALSSSDRSRLSALTGPSFDFGQVKRTLPRAPELVDDESTWLQTRPGTQRLEDLRGQVVAVHFYAFQCINCKRNLPHYQSWFEDYADQGLMIIGIQTPETSAERVPEKVRQAMEASNIEYPVLLDQQSKNWQRWGNTMWPTVYLIDKAGFIRTWWQGELNWQGADGEAQFRQTIERLLAEPAPGEPALDDAASTS